MIVIGRRERSSKERDKIKGRIFSDGRETMFIERKALKIQKKEEKVGKPKNEYHCVTLQEKLSAVWHMCI